MPVNDGLVGNTVLIIQNFENLGKRLDDARVFITIHLYDIDEGNFGLGTVAERLENGGIFLGGGSVVWGRKEQEYRTTHADFTQGETFDLIRPRTPVDGGHQALPDALDQLRFWYRRLFLSGLDRVDDLPGIRKATVV